MKSFYKIFLISLLFPSYALGALVDTERTLIERVVAIVENDPVTLSELDRFIISATDGLEVSDLSREMKVEGLRELIVSKLMEKEADRLGISVDSREVDAYINEILQQNELSLEEFKSLLGERGIPFELYLSQIERDILRTRIVAREVQGRIAVSDQDVERYFEANPSLRPRPGSIRLLQVTVSKEETEAESVARSLRSQAELLLGSNNRNIDFSAFPEGYLNDLGFVLRGNLREDIQQALPSSDEFTSSIIEGRDYYTFYVVISEVSEDGDLPRDLVEETRQRIFSRRYQENLNDYLNTELPNRYLIEMNL